MKDRNNLQLRKKRKMGVNEEKEGKRKHSNEGILISSIDFRFSSPLIEFPYEFVNDSVRRAVVKHLHPPLPYASRQLRGPCLGHERNATAFHARRNLIQNEERAIINEDPKDPMLCCNILHLLFIFLIRRVHAARVLSAPEIEHDALSRGNVHDQASYIIFLNWIVEEREREGDQDRLAD